MIEKMNPMFVRIPNIIMYDTNIVPNAKYLYGIIDMLSYYTETITNDELCEISQISHNSIEKYLKQLQKSEYISIERKRNSRKITPLILKSLEIEKQKDKEQENETKIIKQEKEEHQRKVDLGIIKEAPEYVKKFVKSIK